METVSISQVKRDISELVNRVTYGGERIVLTSRGRPKAAIVSLADLEQLQARGTSTRVERRMKRMTALAEALAIRDQIAARVGGPLPDSAEELRELREERDEQLTGLH